MQAVEDLDLSKVLPLGRQHGILNSLEIVLKNISHLIGAYLPKILQMLLCMTATASHILDQREKVRDIHWGCFLLGLRRVCILLGKWLGPEYLAVFTVLNIYV